MLPKAFYLGFMRYLVFVKQSLESTFVIDLVVMDLSVNKFLYAFFTFTLFKTTTIQDSRKNEFLSQLSYGN